MTYYIAKKNGYFEEEGITIKEKIVEDYSKVYEQVSNGKADIGCGTMDFIFSIDDEKTEVNQVFFCKLQESVEKKVNANPSYLNKYTDLGIYMGMYTNSSYVNHNPDTIQKISNALYKSQVFIFNSNTEDIVPLIEDMFSGMEKTELNNQVEFMKNKCFFPENPITFRDEYETSLKYLKSSAFNKIPDEDLFNKLIDNTYAYKSVDNLDL